MPMLMPVKMPARAKSVTDPLDDRVKARLIRPDGGVGEGYASSSGSEHEGLSGVLRIDGFFFDDSDDEGDRGGRRVDDAVDGWSDDDNQEDGDDKEGNEGEKKRRADSRRSGVKSSSASSSSPFSSLSKHTAAVIRDMMRSPSAAALKHAFRRDLHAAVTAAVERHGHLINSNCSSGGGAVDGGKSAFRRSVMSTLRDAGYNAGVCKSRWGGTSGVSAGSYEYIDVIRPGSSPVAQGERYIVDVGFGAEFEIARPTEEYTRVAAELPAVYVGRHDELKPALRVLADAAKRSMRESGMHVPPWRKLRYILAKWLGPYKRTTKAEPAAPGSSSTSNAAAAAAGAFNMPQSSFGPAAFQKLPATAVVQCRAVGFQQPAKFAIGTPLTRTR